MPTINYTKITDRNVSFGLLRTNPKLTSNIKISIDESDNIWMNSINANEALANQKYKNVAINPDSNHAVNVFRFYDRGKTPSKISFGIGKSIRTDVMARNLKDQYDFDLYTSGAKYLSAQYSEKFSYFAPLYLDAVVPEYFVILRIPGASNYSVGEWRQKITDPNFGQTQFANDLFRNAKIVKTFSLKDDSNIGKYIRNIRRNSMYLQNPLYVNFKEKSYSQYRGISINTGTYVEMPELLSPVLQRAMGQLQMEKYIVGGFERNNIVHPRILNLEFLFSDQTSEDYSINRYLGFYCNAIDLINFDLDFTEMYENDSDNATPLTRVYSKFEEISLSISNPTGVVLRGSGVEEDLSFLKSSLSDPNSILFPYIKTKDGLLHFIKMNAAQDQVQFSQKTTSVTFSIDDSRFNIGTAFGPNNLVSQEISQEVIQDTRSTVLLQLSQIPEHLDTLRIYHQTGSTFDTFDSNGKYDDLIFVKNYFPANVEYSVDYLTAGKIFFEIPVNPNLSSAKFLPNSQQIQNIQYISNNNGSLWQWDGSEYVEGTVVSPVGDPVYFYMEGTADPNNLDQQFTPNIKATSSTTIEMEKTSLTFVVDTVAPFQINDRVKITTGSTRFMLGQITAIVPESFELTININELKGGGEYSDWIITKHDLGIQFVSTADGSLWKTNGKRFTPGTLGSRIYINADGTDTAVLTNIIQKIIADLEYSHLVTDRLDSSIFIQSRAFGDTYRSLALLNKDNSPAFLINGKVSNSVVWADGGAVGAQVIIPAGNITRLSPKLNQIVVKTHKDWSAINRVCHSSAFINNEFGSLTEEKIKNYLLNATIIPTEKERILVSYNKIEIRDIFRPSIGLLSIFEIKDIDFNTYSTSYAKIPEIDLYQYYFLPENARVLDFNNYSYRLLGNGSIEVNGYVYTTNNISDLVWQPTSGLSKYSVLSGDPILTFSNYQPGKNYDSYLKSRAVGTEINSFDFDVDLDIQLNFTKKSQLTLQDDFLTFQAGYISTIINEIDISSIDYSSGPDSETYDIDPGLLYKPDDEVKIIYSEFGDPLTDHFLIGTVTEYNDITGQIVIDITNGQTTLSTFPAGESSIIRTDDLDLFPKYRMQMPDQIQSYIDVRLNRVRLDFSQPIASDFTTIATEGEPTVGGPWTLSRIIPTESALRSDIGIFDRDNNLQSFTGFFGLGADHSQPSQFTDTYENRDRYLTTTLKSEYQIYLENFSKEFATDNRITPYITKWGAIDSTDSRANPYRLNTDVAFGKDNFGPSHRETIPTAEKLTHEWFYIESDFNYSLDPSLLKKNYYYFDKPIDVNRLISEPAYFEEYFTYIPVYDGLEIERPQFRYSKLQRNRYTNKYETIFNGAKFVFSEIGANGNSVPRSKRFVDYNFSILLKPVKEDLLNPQKPVNFRIIENTDSKSILILIEIALSGRDKVGHELLFNNDRIPSARLNQSNFLSTLYTKNPKIYYPSIDILYTTADSPAGNSLFLNISLENNDAVNLSDLSEGVAIDAKTNQVISGYQIQPGQTVLFTKYGTSEQVILAMPGTEIFNLNANNELRDICQSALTVIGPSGEMMPFYKVTTNRRFVVNGISYNPVKIFAKDGNALTEIAINGSNQLPINLITPTWKSIFGDFRISFNENNVSNLTYAFLYSVKDKKFNIGESSFSTVKLAKGVSFSETDSLPAPDISVQQSYSLESKTLKGLPVDAFTLDGFINPISGTAENTGAFSPIMMIGANGIATLAIMTAADFGKLSLDQNIIDIQSPRLTNHGIKSVSTNEVILLKSSPVSSPTLGIFETPIGPSGSVIGPSGLVYINTINEYAGDIVIAAEFSPEYSDQYQVDDLVVLTNGLIEASRVNLFGRITEKTILQVGAITYPASLISIYYQDRITPTSGSGSVINSKWFINKVEKPTALELSVISENSGIKLGLTNEKLPIPGLPDLYWTDSNQQFQLFGGADYFTNLFENISFANFIKLLENGSEILSWETYSNGSLVLRPETKDQFFSIEVEQADIIKKKTIVQPIEQRIETPSRAEVGGYEPIESASIEYEVFRYSGEYEILFRPVSSFSYYNTLNNFKLDGANVRLNTNVSDFFILPEFSYVKYSDINILDLESASKYRATYPLIGESPIDYDTFNALSSSWDFGYHYKYLTKRDKTAIPGSNRIIEDYSFLSKLINLPTDITVEPTSFTEVSNIVFDSSDTEIIENQPAFIYSVYQNSVRVKINFNQLLSEKILENGLGSQFNQFFKDELGQVVETDLEFLGNLTLSQYKLQYCENNLAKLFQLDKLNFFFKPDYDLEDTTISFSQVDYADLESSGYKPITNVQINNPKSRVLVCTIPRQITSGINIVPKLKIKYI